MKFKSYLNEVDEFTKMVTDIEKNCKPFLKDWKKLNTSKWLMSGRKENIDWYKEKPVRKSRTPKDTPLELHELLDAFFYTKFGVNSRSNAVFCSFNPNQADDYGKIFLIFPIGKYKVVSSKKIDDIFNLMSSIFKEYTAFMYFHQERYNTLNDDEMSLFKREFIRSVKNGKYTDKLTFHNNEIMLTCKSYYIVNDKFNGQLLEYFGAL